MTIPIILHIPHSSKVIPENIRNQFFLSDQELKNELLLMTDAYTDELFGSGNTEYDTIIFPISRLVVDPERFIDDKLESMYKIGMGVIYTKASHGEQLRRSTSESERDYLLNTYYHPHHKNLTDTVKNHLNQCGKALIIDCHSFPSTPLPYEFNQSKNRPDICIGTDDFHTHKLLSQKCAQLFERKGYSVKFNEPFGGSLVPGKYYKKNKNVQSLMIEINRRLYLDEKTGEKNSGYDNLKMDLKWIIAEFYN